MKAIKIPIMVLSIMLVLSTATFVGAWSPDPPKKPTGPTSGEVGVSYTFSTNAPNYVGVYPIYYKFYWDDSHSDLVGPFSSGSTLVTVNHTWNVAGDYEIGVTLCMYDSDVLYESDMSETLTFIIPEIIPNPPEQPLTPFGPTDIGVGKVYVWYLLTLSYPTEWYNYSYIWDWGDGTTTVWPYSTLFILTQRKTYTEVGTYELKVKAVDAWQQESDWSEPLVIHVKGAVVTTDKEIYGPGEIVLCTIENQLNLDIELLSVSLTDTSRSSKIDRASNIVIPAGDSYSFYIITSILSGNEYDIEVTYRYVPAGDTCLATTSFKIDSPPLLTSFTVPSTGYINEMFTIRMNATDPDGDDVYYQLYRDGTEFTGWMGPYQNGIEYPYIINISAIGNYKWKVHIKDIYDIESYWSDEQQITISYRTPSNPTRPSGPATLFKNEAGTYSTSVASVAGHTVYYKYTWGDGTSSSWSTSASASHSYSSPGTYNIYVNASYYSTGISASGSQSLSVHVSEKQDVNITLIKGGLGIKTTLKNIGDVAAQNVKYDIIVTKGIFSQRTVANASDVITSIAVGEETVITTKCMGFGRITITVDITFTGGTDSEEASGFLLGPIVIIRS